MSAPLNPATPDRTGQADRLDSITPGVLVLLSDQSLESVAGECVRGIIAARSPSMCRAKLLAIASEAEARYDAKVQLSHPIVMRCYSLHPLLPGCMHPLLLLVCPVGVML